jgi:hypothetical protein
MSTIAIVVAIALFSLCSWKGHRPNHHMRRESNARIRIVQYSLDSLPAEALA